MTPYAQLGSLIQSQHLEPESVENNAARFSSDPAKLIVLDNFLIDDVIEGLNRFLTRDVVFEVLYGLYSKGYGAGSIPGVARQDWLNAKDEERFFRFRQLAHVVPESPESPGLQTAEQFFNALRTSIAREYFEAVSGLRLGGVKINAYSYRKGDFLRLHSDNDELKRLAFVLYLSPDWEARFGGELNVIALDGTRRTIEARYNSLILFDVTAGTEHYVSQIKSSAGKRQRLSIGGWYYKPQPSGNEQF